MEISVMWLLLWDEAVSGKCGSGESHLDSIPLPVGDVSQDLLHEVIIIHCAQRPARSCHDQTTPGSGARSLVKATTSLPLNTADVVRANHTATTKDSH